ncbi:MAG: cupin domain-containing protein, partial [Acidimicrobiia bacterium]
MAALAQGGNRGEVPLAEVRVLKRAELVGGVPSGGMVRLAAISAETVGSEGIFMGLARVSPGLRSSPHVHTNCESALYVASGRGRLLVGPRLERSLEVEAGDFIYVPPDAPHVVVNDGDVDLLLVIARTTQEERVADHDPDAGAAARSGPEVRVLKRAELAGGVSSGGMVRLAAISAETVGSQGIFMGLARVPPGLRSSPHIHTNCESALYAGSGRGRFLVGPRVEHSLELEPGDFTYVPANAPHVVVNDGDVDLLLVVARTAQEERVAEYDPDARDAPEKAAAPLEHPLLANRCKTCHVRIRGPLAVVSRLRGIGPYKKNPQLCSRCESRIKGAEDRVVTALFADIRGSTAMAHDGSSTELLRVLRRFFHTSAEVAYDHYGMVDRFLGDGMLVFFNVPAPRATHSEDAVKTALGIEEALRGASFGVGIGIE